VKRYTIDDEWAGSRIDRFVRAIAKGIPYTTLQMLFRKGSIRLNGGKTRGGARLSAGDVVSVDSGVAAESASRVPSAPGRASPVPATLERFGLIGGGIPVLYEDDDLVILDKPSGLVVQPGNRNARGSLLDILDEYRLRTGGGGGTASFPYTPVHRLDRETSGLLVVAKKRPAARLLSSILSSGRAEKTYLAVTERAPRPESGTIRTPIRVRKSLSSRAETHREGKRSVTRYRTVRRLPGGRALVEIRIETGRTHQIRVHLASIGSPILGDSKYGATSPGRLMLHAWKLRIPYPGDGDAIEAVAPPPPGFESTS